MKGYTASDAVVLHPPGLRQIATEEAGRIFRRSLAVDEAPEVRLAHMRRAARRVFLAGGFSEEKSVDLATAVAAAVLADNDR